jgi:hypothetical protein
MIQATYNLYPEIEPFNKNWLKVDHLHEIYFEECGNPDGIPVVFLHGGPGYNCVNFEATTAQQLADKGFFVTFAIRTENSLIKSSSILGNNSDFTKGYSLFIYPSP